MDLVYFFYPRNFTIKEIFKIELNVLTQVDVMPRPGEPRLVHYLLGGQVHTYLGEEWPPRRHTFRPPMKRAVVESTGRDVTAIMKKIEGPSWLAGVTWVPMRPKIAWSLGLGPSGIKFKIKIFKKFFLKEEGPVSIHLWC